MNLYDFGPSLTVDISLDQIGQHHVTSEYAETFWLPLVGPSVWCLARIFARQTGTVVYSTDLLGHVVGLHGSARLNRSLNRLCYFGWGSVRVGDGVLVATAWLPDVSGGRLARLPAYLRELHHHLQTALPVEVPS